MATLCGQPAEVQIQSPRNSTQVRVMLRPSGIQRVLSWATALTAEAVICSAGDDRLEDELAKFGGPAEED